MVFASTLRVAFVRLLQLTLLYAGVRVRCRHWLVHRFLSSWLWFILLLQNQFSQKMPTLTRESRLQRVNAFCIAVGFFFFSSEVQQTPAELAHPASHPCAADTTALRSTLSGGRAATTGTRC